MTANTPPKSSRAGPSIRLGVRIAIAVFLVALVVAYSVAIVSGAISEGRKIDAVHFALIVLTALIASLLVQPEIFERFKRLKLSGFELEMLERVRAKQAAQESQLDDIRLILPLLLPEIERNYLLNLARGKTSGYRGNHSLRGQLRRLRSIGLLRMKKDREVGDMKDGVEVDLATFVELTPLGEGWVRRIREIEQSELLQENQSMNTQGT
jgi:hypothetical protein